MIRNGIEHRNGFSLLEVILATAILAGSAMVLTSLIGLGSKYGRRAEERTAALLQAESIMEEYLAASTEQNSSSSSSGSSGRFEERSGELPGIPRRSYKVSARVWENTSSNDSQISPSSRVSQSRVLPKNSLEPTKPELLLVTVELYDGGAESQANTTRPLHKLSRLARRIPAVDPLNADASTTIPGSSATIPLDKAGGRRVP